MFILQNAPWSNREIAGVRVEPFLLPGESSKFDLTLIAAEGAEGLRTTIEYNTDLFDQPRMERMLGHFQVMLQAAVANPEMRLSELPLLTERERKLIVVDWNGTQAEDPRNLCLHD